MFWPDVTLFVAKPLVQKRSFISIIRSFLFALMPLTLRITSSHYVGRVHDKGPRARDLALPLQHFGGWVPIRPARLGTAVLAEDEAAVPVLRRVGVGHTTEHIA
jgi:hypothetical protein